MRTERPLPRGIDARQHLANLAGQTVFSVLDGTPHKILGVTRDHAFVTAVGAPLGKPISIAEVQAAFDRLARGEDVELSGGSLGKDSSFLSAALLSIPGAELRHGPARIAVRAG